MAQYMTSHSGVHVRYRYDGWSYEEIMLTPLARTLAPFLKAARLERIDFGLQVKQDRCVDAS